MTKKKQVPALLPSNIDTKTLAEALGYPLSPPRFRRSAGVCHWGRAGNKKADEWEEEDDVQ